MNKWLCSLLLLCLCFFEHAFAIVKFAQKYEILVQDSNVGSLTIRPQGDSQFMLTLQLDPIPVLVPPAPAFLQLLADHNPADNDINDFGGMAAAMPVPCIEGLLQTTSNGETFTAGEEEFDEFPEPVVEEGQEQTHIYVFGPTLAGLLNQAQQQPDEPISTNSDSILWPFSEEELPLQFIANAEQSGVVTQQNSQDEHSAVISYQIEGEIVSSVTYQYSGTQNVVFQRVQRQKLFDMQPLKSSLPKHKPRKRRKRGGGSGGNDAKRNIVIPETTVMINHQIVLNHLNMVFPLFLFLGR